MRKVRVARPVRSAVAWPTLLPANVTVTDFAAGKFSAEQVVSTLALWAGTVVTLQVIFGGWPVVCCGGQVVGPLRARSAQAVSRLTLHVRLILIAWPSMGLSTLPLLYFLWYQTRASCCPKDPPPVRELAGQAKRADRHIRCASQHSQKGVRGRLGPRADF
jgi:hypothetical protein